MIRVLVAANDPGGAQAILPVVLKLEARGDEVLALLTGPACAIFAQRGVAHEVATDWDDSTLTARVAAFTPDIFLAGTSTGIGIDKRLMQHLASSIPAVYVLDFWNNYALRFSHAENDLRYLPDRVCVMDETAHKGMREAGIPEERIVITGNPYFEHFTEHVLRDDEDARRVLFISQPISEHVGKPYGFDEFDALRGLISALPATHRLTIRLHPRDDQYKYDSFLSESVQLSDEPNVERDLSRAGLVVGMFSPVLMQAALAGKVAISFQPGRIGDDPLPTNATGITFSAETQVALVHAIQAYLQGERSERVQHAYQGPTDATKAVLRVIDDVTRRPHNEL